MAGGNMLMLGGGNPAHIPEVQQVFRKRIEAILAEPSAFESMIGNYDTARGNTQFIETLATMLKEEFGWPIGPENIALTNGSQNAFFALFNLFAGEMPDGSQRQILFPLAPEYIGYTDAGLCDGFFTAKRPKIDPLDKHRFKYRIDFESLEIDDHIGAICVSRPTNPTGNVLSDEEIIRLDQLAKQHDIPLMIDNAYGTPFPDIIFSEAQPIWNTNTIVCMSLSKFGLPNLRTGIVIARPEIATALGDISGVMHLAPGGLGPRIAIELVRDKSIMELSRQLVRPYYQQRMEQAVACLHEELEDSIPWHLHNPEGAIFLWLWFPGLPCTAQELYERLKARNLLIIPGHHFFPGLENENWAHKNECIRLTYSQENQTVREGIRILADELKTLYGASNDA